MSRKVCAIVGVGPGLGMAIARRFGREGFALALVARNPDTLLGLRDVLRAEGHEAVAFRADAASPSDLERALTEVAETLGHPAVLVYNAAAPRRGTPTTLAPEVLVEDFRVDVVGALAAVRTVVPRMKSNRSGAMRRGSVIERRTKRIFPSVRETATRLYSSVEKPVHVHDFHATMLHCLGLDHLKLTYMHNGRAERPTIVGGSLVPEIWT